MREVDSRALVRRVGGMQCTGGGVGGPATGAGTTSSGQPAGSKGTATNTNGSCTSDSRWWRRCSISRNDWVDSTRRQPLQLLSWNGALNAAPRKQRHDFPSGNCFSPGGGGGGGGRARPRIVPATNWSCPPTLMVKTTGSKYQSAPCMPCAHRPSSCRLYSCFATQTVRRQRPASSDASQDDST